MLMTTMTLVGIGYETSIIILSAIILIFILQRYKEKRNTITKYLFIVFLNVTLGMRIIHISQSYLGILLFVIGPFESVVRSNDPINQLSLYICI